MSDAEYGLTTADNRWLLIAEAQGWVRRLLAFDLPEMHVDDDKNDTGSQERCLERPVGVQEPRRMPVDERDEDREAKDDCTAPQPLAVNDRSNPASRCATSGKASTSRTARFHGSRHELAMSLRDQPRWRFSPEPSVSLRPAGSPNQQTRIGRQGVMVRQKSVQAGSFASGSELDVKSPASETRAGTKLLWSRFDSVGTFELDRE
ncbi:MAG: hypothetical protein ACJ8AW_18655 [Rhodopila sp.]